MTPALSQPADPPQQWKADTSSQAFKDRYALAKGRAVDWLKGQLKKEGLDIARRTVTKYRESMNLLSSTKRRQVG